MQVYYIHPNSFQNSIVLEIGPLFAGPSRLTPPPSPHSPIFLFSCSPAARFCMFILFLCELRAFITPEIYSTVAIDSNQDSKVQHSVFLYVHCR